MALYYLLLILIAGCAAVSIVVSIYFRARAFTLSNQLQKAKQSMAEGNVFSDLFSKNVRTLGDSVNWMNITARYVADAVDAVGLCIFRLDESKQSLTLTGSAGRIPRNLQTVQSVSQEGSLKDPDTGEKQLTVLEQVIFLRKEILLGSRQEAQLNQIDIDPHCHVNTMMAIPITAVEPLTRIAFDFTEQKAYKKHPETGCFLLFAGVLSHARFVVRAVVVHALRKIKKVIF